MKKFTLLSTIILAVLTATAQIIHVPADQPTIQQGIDAASDGDTVLVADGTYLENINFNGMAITLASEFILNGDTNHINNTIIDGSQPTNPNKGSVVTFESEEDTTSVLVGFTITGGTGTFVQSHNSWSGGGIQCYPAGAKIIHNKIIYNTIESDGGGYGAGILCDHENNSWIVIDGNVISNNSINSINEAFGGGISVFGQARIENNEVSNNLAYSIAGISGGGVNCKGTFYDPNFKEIILTNNFIDNNTATSLYSTNEGSYFGGLYIEGFFGLVQSNRITNNSVSASDGNICYGAGIMSIRNPDNIVFENNIIKDNYFTSGTCWGGGICIWMGGGVYQNNVIQNNQASLGGGMFIYSFETDEIPFIINNTITGNDATDLGGGLYIYGSDVVVMNTILWGNTVGSLISSIYLAESNLEVRHSNIEGGWPGSGNMDVTPFFNNDGYHLDYPSTLLNEGKSSVLINGEWYDCPEYDIDGDERPFENTYPDIGADEAQWLYVSVDESISTANSLVSVFPNPATNHLTISTENEILIKEVNIYNQIGQKVLQKSQISNPIDVSMLSQGMYIIEVVTDEFKIWEKLVIKK